MKIIHRLFQFIEYKGLTPAQAERNWGLSNGYLASTLKRSGDVGESKLMGILDKNLELSREWLVFGEGPMLKDEYSYQVESDTLDPLKFNEPQASYSLPQQSDTMTDKEIIEMLRSTIELQKFKIDALNRELREVKQKEELQKNI